MHVRGNVSGAEDLVVEGRIDGRVQLAGRLTVQAGAKIEADVEADTVTVAGEITGDVRASVGVHVLAGGTIRGNVRAPRVSLVDGARVDGGVEMPVDLPSELSDRRGR